MPGASDPDRPSGISPCQSFRSIFVFSVLCLVSRQCHNISTIVLSIDSFVLASGYLTPSPPALHTLTRLNRFRVVRHPSGLQDSLCTLRPHCIHVTQYNYRIHHSARDATLDTDGWLALTKAHNRPPTDRDFHPARSAKLSLAH